MANEAGLPKSVSSFMFTFFKREGSTVLLMGHPPSSVIEQALRAPVLPRTLVIDQPEMHDENPRTYDLRLAQDEVKRFDARTPLDEALRQVGAIGGN